MEGQTIMVNESNVEQEAVPVRVCELAAVSVDLSRQRIPRPPNAFMLFANQFRKQLAVANPRESNKDISVRLGVMWKTMPKEQKDIYFAKARAVDAEHKKKYPNYVYNPKEARLRKAMREQSRESRLTGRPGGLGARGGATAGWAATRQRGAAPGISMQSCKLECPEELRKSVREQVEQGLLSGYTEQFLDFETITPYSMGLMGMPEYNFFPEFTGNMWYNQGSQHGGTSYLSRQSEDKYQSFGSWNVCGNDNRGSQVMTRQQMLGGTSQFAVTQNGNCTEQNASHIASMQMPHSGMFQKIDHTREDNIRVNTPALTGAQQKQQQHNQIMQRQQQQQQQQQQQHQQQQSKQSNSKRQQANILPTTTTSRGSTTANTSSAPVDSKPLPAFEQAFGSTEIGRFSHEGFFSSMQQQLQQQQQQQQQLQSQHQSSQQQQQQQQLLHLHQQQQQVTEKDLVFTAEIPSFSGSLNEDFHSGGPPCSFLPPSTPLTTDKLEAGDILVSPSNWPSLFYYTPVGPAAAYFDNGMLSSGIGCGSDCPLLAGPETGISAASNQLLSKQEAVSEHVYDKEREGITIPGLKVKECTIISQTERICVLKEAEMSSSDITEFSPLSENRS